MTPPSDSRLLQTKLMPPSKDKEQLKDKRAMSSPLDRGPRETGAMFPPSDQSLSPRGQDHVPSIRPGAPEGTLPVCCLLSSF